MCVCVGGSRVGEHLYLAAGASVPEYSDHHGSLPTVQGKGTSHARTPSSRHAWRNVTVYGGSDTRERVCGFRGSAESWDPTNV